MSLAVQLASTDRAAQEARRLLRAELGDRVPAVTLYDLLTVVTELVTNAVRYGEGDAVGLTVRVAADGTISGEVENVGSRELEVRPLEAEPHGGGLGLHIVGALAGEWRVDSEGDVTRVSFVLRSP